AERPHLVSLGSGRLSTAITLLALPEGRTTLGHGATDINVHGPGVAGLHCFIENKAGVITLHPCGNPCSMDGLPVTKPARLSQGCMLCFGQSSFFRFNHPEEAFRMKSMQTEAEGPSVTSAPRTGEDSESLVNGNHQSAAAKCHAAPCERALLDHSAMVSSMEKDLQDIMDSLIMDDPQVPSSSELKMRSVPHTDHSSLSPMLNGGGRYLLSPPTSPGAIDWELQLDSGRHLRFHHGNAIVVLLGGGLVRSVVWNEPTDSISIAEVFIHACMLNFSFVCPYQTVAVHRGHTAGGVTAQSSKL
uniref:FHA domain-containing protein n=1 Tax=Electrophorus electricus TaxID=8005 RepID=A0AAY5F6E6_ELEEL